MALSVDNSDTSTPRISLPNGSPFLTSDSLDGHPYTLNDADEWAWLILQPSTMTSKYGFRFVHPGKESWGYPPRSGQAWFVVGYQKVGLVCPNIPDSGKPTILVSFCITKDDGDLHVAVRSCWWCHISKSSCPLAHTKIEAEEPNSQRQASDLTRKRPRFSEGPSSVQQNDSELAQWQADLAELSKQSRAIADKLSAHSSTFPSGLISGQQFRDKIQELDKVRRNLKIGQDERSRLNEERNAAEEAKIALRLQLSKAQLEAQTAQEQLDRWRTRATGLIRSRQEEAEEEVTDEVELRKLDDGELWIMMFKE